MTRTCDVISKKSVLFGNNVSHSNRKTRRKFIPNLHNKTLISKALGRKISLKIAVSTLRSIENAGGLDEYLIKAPKKILTDKALFFRAKIVKFSKKKT